MPPLLLLKLRSDVSTAPVLLLIFTLVLPEIVITPVNVMSPTTLMSASLAIALDSALNEDTSVLSRRRRSSGGTKSVSAIRNWWRGVGGEPTAFARSPPDLLRWPRPP